MAPGSDAAALLLRPWCESDAPALREAIDENVDHLRPWLTWTLEEPTTLERTRERLRGYVQQWGEGRAFRYAITPRERPATILGGVHLEPGEGPSVHGIGYWVRGSATRRGVAAAAVSRLSVHAFEERNADRLVAGCDVANDASAALARALGFRFVGRVAGSYPDGSPRPLLEFEMDRRSYRRRHGRSLRRRARRVRLATDRPGPSACDP